MSIRFGTAHERWLYGVFTMLWVSGAIWLLFHYFLRNTGEFGETAHPLEIWCLRLHGLMAFLALVTVGSVLPVHARRAWQLKKNRISGVGLKLVLGWLAVTGYALYYFSSEYNEAWLPLLHWGVGVAFPLALVFHIHRGRAKYRRNKAHARIKRFMQAS